MIKIKRSKATICILPLLLALVSQTVGQNYGCEFKDFDRERSPVFVRTAGSIKRFLDPRTPVEIPHGGSVTVYCDIKLTGSTEDDDWLPNQQFVLKCKNGSVSNDDYNYKKDYYFCHVPGYFRYPNEDCKGDHYVTGLKVDDIKIMFASICYNMGNLTTQFVKYVPKTRGNLVSQQEGNNPVPQTHHFSSEPSYVDMPQIAFNVLSDHDIREQLRNLVGDMSNALSYSESSLLPSHIFSPILNHEDKVNTIIWWNQLRHGNWKVIQNRLSLQDDVEVYAGTSHVATADDRHSHKVGTSHVDIADDRHKVDLEFEKLNGHRIVAPLYVWNYVKHKNPDQDVVIIGINSPFVAYTRDVQHTYTLRNGDFTDTSEEACSRDSCSQVEWLRGVKTLKLPAFGYILCCKPSEVKIKLDGLPTKFLTSQTGPTPGYYPYDYDTNGYNPGFRPSFNGHSNGQRRDLNNFHYKLYT